MIKHAWKATDEDEEKFQREILADEPNLIKLYLQQRGDRNSWNGTSRGEFDSNEASFSEDACSKVQIIESDQVGFCVLLLFFSSWPIFSRERICILEASPVSKLSLAAEIQMTFSRQLILLMLQIGQLCHFTSAKPTAVIFLRPFLPNHY